MNLAEGSQSRLIFHLGSCFTLGFNNPVITKCPPFPRTQSGGIGKE